MCHDPSGDFDGFTLTAVPHRVMESDVYDGYYIPVDRFYPERWLSAGAPSFPNQVFGFGARRCPGRFFAKDSIWSAIAGILAAFDISPTEDGPPEESYMSGVVSCVTIALYSVL